MEKLVINGTNRLEGEVKVHGAKNSVLPILAATLLVDGVSVIHNCPMLSDVEATIKILKHFGCVVERQGHTVSVDAANVNGCSVPDDLMHEMRSSIIFLGSILGRMGRAVLTTPGGCEIGLRPIDLHLSALKQFGYSVKNENGSIVCEGNAKSVSGTKINLAFPSVGATENIILASVYAKGRTLIRNAAGEPEIKDLADFLNKCGAKIYGAGTDTILIEGVTRLKGTEHRVIPDRIEASSYLIATAATGGEAHIKDIIPSHIESLLEPLRETGCAINLTDEGIYLKAPERLKRFKMIRTMPYPGFPTDAQAQMTALAAKCQGTSVVVENIFESRFKYVGQLLRFGAVIDTEGRMAVIEGVRNLYGARVKATDLRGGFAMIIAGLCAEGTTEITDIYHIDRGYEMPEKVISALGGSIKRVKEDE